ncbi:MAG: uncharacterized protein KVP18_001867 [Porospora cf. gigantea A]|nr:MAG: hypothetical protein KVP18_001867 [Porospora cf. gigantea A]
MLVHGFFGLSSFLFCWLRCKSWDVSLQMNNPRFSTISRNEVKFLSLTLFSYLTAVTVHLWLPHFNVHVSLQSRSRVFIFSCLSAIHLAFQWLLLILLGGVQYNFLPSVIFGTAIISGWALVVFPQWLRVSFDPLIYPWLSWLWQFAGIVGTLLLLGVSDITNRLRPFEDEVVWSYILLAWQTPLVLLLFHFAKYEGRVRLNGLPVVCVIDEEVLPVPKLCWRSDATIPFFHPRLYQSECSAEDVIFTGHSAAELTEKMRVLFEGKSDQTQDTKVDAKARLQLRLQQLIQSGDSDETSERRSDGESFDERPGSAEVSREAMHAWTFGVDEDAWWQGYVDSPPTMQRHSFAERNRAASDLDRVHSLWDSSQPEDSRPRLLDDLGQLSWLDSAEERVSRQTPILQTLGSLSGLHSTSDCEGNRDESEEAPFIHPQYVLEALDGQHDDAQERLEDLVSEGEDQVSSP